MKKTLFALAAVATLATGFAVPANADSLTVQFGGGPAYHDGWHNGYRHHRITRDQAVRIVRHRGFYRIYAVSYRGDRYVVRASRGRGRAVLVSVDARRGYIMSVRPVRPAWGYRHYY